MKIVENSGARTSTDVDVAIMGGGIGGVAAALALRNAGIDAHIFERTVELREVGGAVLIREPSAKLFEEWGVAQQFYEKAVEVEEIDVRDAAGAHVRTADVDRAGDGKSYSIHRADVHAAMLAGVAPENLHLGKECVDVFQEADRGVAVFSDGTCVSARVLVGADGIRSKTRHLVSDDEMVFAGLVVLRGMAPAANLPANVQNDRITMWGQEPRMMVLLPVHGGAEMAMDSVRAQKDPPTDLWTSEVPTNQLLEFFDGFDPALLDLIRAGTVPVRANPVYERDPIEKWSVGNVTLLGDAAHPMAPRMGQGANMAIQDAGALAAALSELGLDRAVEALQRYERARIEPTARMQLASRTSPRVSPQAGAAR
jgi:salicylate hydroxylase